MSSLDHFSQLLPISCSLWGCVSSFVCSHLCAYLFANIDCANTSGRFIGAFVCVWIIHISIYSMYTCVWMWWLDISIYICMYMCRYIVLRDYIYSIYMHYMHTRNTHNCRCTFICVCMSVGVIFYKSVLLFVSVPIPDYQSAVCLTTGAVSFDCIDSVPLRAVMKHEKWTVCSEHEVIGLHLVSHGSQEAEEKAKVGRRGVGRVTAWCVYKCMLVLVVWSTSCVLSTMDASAHSEHNASFILRCDVGNKIISAN